MSSALALSGFRAWFTLCRASQMVTNRVFLYAISGLSRAIASTEQVDSCWDPDIRLPSHDWSTGLWTKCWLTTIGRCTVQPVFQPVLRRATRDRGWQLIGRGVGGRRWRVRLQIGRDPQCCARITLRCQLRSASPTPSASQCLRHSAPRERRTPYNVSRRAQHGDRRCAWIAASGSLARSCDPARTFAPQTRRGVV